ncbi:MAG TPA: homocysteine S-methyltransferase family protein [Geodermatophilus sp.]|nr:homocysteine S-methyltransferase family protein [Geodermatophilus sp.]
MAAVPGWVRAGARLVGGCCRVGPAGIAAIAATLPATLPASPPRDQVT